MPPSTSILPSRSTGGNTSGSDIVARIAVANEPRSITTGVALNRSTATARNGVGSSSNVWMSKYGAAMPPTIKSTCWPLFSEVGGTMPRARPNSSRDG